MIFPFHVVVSPPHKFRPHLHHRGRHGTQQPAELACFIADAGAEVAAIDIAGNDDAFPNNFIGITPELSSAAIPSTKGCLAAAAAAILGDALCDVKAKPCTTDAESKNAITTADTAAVA